MFPARSLALIASLAAALALAGCNKGTSSQSDSSSSTTETADNTAALPAGHPQLPAQTPQLPAGHPAMPPTTLPADRPIIWTLPKDWTEQAGMPPRYAVIRPPDDRPAELAVTIFPGNVGGTLANINRWRAQVGAQPITEADLEKNITRFDSNNLKIIIADIPGPKTEDPAMLAAIVPDSANDSTWFFKLVGSKDNVAKNKDDFTQLVRSIRLIPGK
ncbi:MAG: hypothetical protein NTU53_04685 [Planctomycetota bacterium]|nr:hypothetical protein [Planctomycetota bacterium]